MKKFLPQILYAPADDNPGGDTPPAQMPEGLPANFWDGQSGQVNLPDFIKSYGELSTFKTQHDERVAALPKEAKDYKVEIKVPDGYKVPQGLELKVDEKDARLTPLRDFAKKYGLSQDAMNELVWLDTQHNIDRMQAEEAAVQAEMAKLGENGKARTDAVDAYLKANLPEEYEAMRPFVADAVAFAGVEKLIAKATAQRVPPNNDPPREETKPKPRLADRFYGQQKAS